MNDTIPALEQFIEPSPVKFTPDAPGWFALGIFLIILFLYMVFLTYVNYRKNRYRKISLHWLEQEKERLVSQNNYAQLVYVADMLAKRIMIRLHGKEEVTTLQGAKWIDYLNKSCPAVSFTAADDQIIRAVYEPEEVNKQQAIEFVGKVELWIKKHRLK